MANVTDLIKSDVVIGLDEIVSVFVSKYEDELHEKRAATANTIRELKKKLEDLEKTCIDAVNKNNYEFVNQFLDVRSVIKSVKFNSMQKQAQIEVKVQKGSNDNYRYSFHYTYDEDISTEHKQMYDELINELTTRTSEFLTINQDIKDVGRKERKVRARICEMKLKEGGYNELLQNQDLLNLIEVK